MTKDGIAGIIAAVILAMLTMLIGSDWVIEAFVSDPAAAVCFTLCAIAVGYLAHALVHHDELKLRAQVDEQREAIADRDVRIAKLEKELGTEAQDAVDGFDSRLSEVESRPHLEKRENGNWTLRGL